MNWPPCRIAWRRGRPRTRSRIQTSEYPVMKQARYADCMTGARIPRLAFRLVLAAFILTTSTSALPARAQTRDRVTLTPAIVVAGSPELICVHLPAGATVNGEWLVGTGPAQKLEFFRGRDGHAWYALAGVDVKAQTGPSTLKISARMADGRSNRPEPQR